MGYYLEIISPTGERSEGRLIALLSEAGARLHLHDADGHGFAAGRFIVRVDDKGAELLPMKDDVDRGWGFRGYKVRIDATGTTLEGINDSETSAWTNRSNAMVGNVPEYPQILWSGDFIFGIASLSVAPVTQDKKNRRDVATVRLSWGTAEDEYLDMLQKLISICERLGFQLHDGQRDFGVISLEHLGMAVQNFSRCTSVVRGVVGEM